MATVITVGEQLVGIIALTWQIITTRLFPTVGNNMATRNVPTVVGNNVVAVVTKNMVDTNTVNNNVAYEERSEWLR